MASNGNEPPLLLAELDSFVIRPSGVLQLDVHHVVAAAAKTAPHQLLYTEVLCFS